MGGGNFKNGSVSLDWEDSDESDNEEESIPESGPAPESTTHGESSDAPSPIMEETQQDEASSTTTDSTSNQYPYFIRRSNVSDERSNRMEVHLRNEVAEDEGDFLNALANELDTDHVAKTDAREFALKLAFENPDKVARLMRDEGYGELS